MYNKMKNTKRMKNMTLLVAGMICILSFNNLDAQSMYVGGSSKGEIKSNGDIYIGGSQKGKIESDGDVYINGSQKGKIESDGDIYVNGSQKGKVESDGDGM